jgi:hypothetical protein
MKTNEGSLTLRQQYEAHRQGAPKQTQPNQPEDALLRALLGREVMVKFQSGGEVIAAFTALDRFTISLGSDLVVFKHAIQSVRLAGGHLESA